MLLLLLLLMEMMMALKKVLLLKSEREKDNGIKKRYDIEVSAFASNNRFDLSPPSSPLFFLSISSHHS